jgi:cytochrome c
MKTSAPFLIAAASLLAAASTAFAQAPAADPAMDKLLKDNNCLSCHATDKKLVGPSYKAVAEKYAKDKDAQKNLAAKMVKGGSGVWGPIPMPAAAQLKTEDAEKLAKWILAVK